jgi:integrase
MIVERHIIPALGSLRLSQLTTGRVQAWIDADPLAVRTVHHHRAVLRRALNVAVRQRKLAYNPAALVELPGVDADHSDPLTADEARALLEATRDDRLGALWRLALATGLRQGELLGLAWDDVAGDRITVHAQLQRLPASQGGDVHGWARTPPKAARKVERLTIDPDTAAALDAHRVRQAAERTPDWRYFGLVFVTERGDPFHPSVIRKAFRLACVAAGIRPRRFHDMRHARGFQSVLATGARLATRLLGLNPSLRATRLPDLLLGAAVTAPAVVGNQRRGLPHRPATGTVWRGR